MDLDIHQSYGVDFVYRLIETTTMAELRSFCHMCPDEVKGGAGANVVQKLADRSPQLREINMALTKKISNSEVARSLGLFKEVQKLDLSFYKDPGFITDDDFDFWSMALEAGVIRRHICFGWAVSVREISCEGNREELGQLSNALSRSPAAGNRFGSDRFKELTLPPLTGHLETLNILCHLKNETSEEDSQRLACKGTFSLS